MGTPLIVFLVRDQSFDIKLTGLLPSTYHYLYYEGKRVDTNSFKPLGGKLGDPLISDENGQISLTLYVNTNLPEAVSALADYYKIIDSVVGKKQVVVMNINQTDLPTDYKTTAFSYAESYITIEAFRPTQEQFNAGFGEQ